MSCGSFVVPTWCFLGEAYSGAFSCTEDNGVLERTSHALPKSTLHFLARYYGIHVQVFTLWLTIPFVHQP